MTDISGLASTEVDFAFKGADSHAAFVVPLLAGALFNGADSHAAAITASSSRRQLDR
jgi:hypothetical protein